MKPHRLPILLTLASSFLLFAACGNEPAKTPADPSGASAAEKKPAPPTPEVLARLAQADAVDGRTDKLVEKCAACALNMAGKPDKQLAVGEYKMHFCSDRCLDTYRADPNGQIMAMKLPR
jgi:hypothetical protein